MDKTYQGIIVVLFLSGCATQDEWTSADTTWQILTTSMIAADAYVSSSISDHPNIVENGPIAKQFIGENPNADEVWKYAIGISITNYLIARYVLRGNWRTAWQVGTGIRHGLAANKGHQMGLTSEPCTTLTIPEEFRCAP